MTSASQMQLYIKRWHPSKYVLDPLEELILDTSSIEELNRKVLTLLKHYYSVVVNIPCRYLSIAEFQLIEYPLLRYVSPSLSPSLPLSPSLLPLSLSLSLPPFLSPCYP